MRPVMDQDLFGKAFADYYIGKRYRFDIERDDGYVNEQDMGVFFDDYDKFPAADKKALRYAKGKVLDIGVGAGRVALYLQGKGLEVVGIDISDRALDVCRRRGVRKLIKMSACDLRFKKNSFDTAIAFCNNFGLCGDMKGVEKMMAGLHKIVRDGGVFLASTINPTRTKNKAHLRYHRWNIKRGRPPGQVTLRDRYRGNVGAWWDLLLVRPSEMRALCERTGWKIERTYRDVMDVYVLRRI